MKHKVIIFLMAIMIVLTGCATAQNNGQATASDKIYLREAARFLQSPDDPTINRENVARNIRNGLNLTSKPDQYEQLATYIESNDIDSAKELYTELSGKEIE